MATKTLQSLWLPSFIFLCLLCIQVTLCTQNFVPETDICKNKLSGTWQQRNGTTSGISYVRLKNIGITETIDNGRDVTANSRLILKGSALFYNYEADNIKEGNVVLVLQSNKVSITYSDKSFHGKLVNCSYASWEDGSYWVKVQDVNYVHVVYMNHLDVGYNGLIDERGFVNNVLNRYFNVYFPRAVRVAENLRLLGGRESLVYTTHPWLVSLYVDCPQQMVLAGIKLKCPTKEEVENFEQAVLRGDITWHAGPMNLQTDNIDDSLFNYALSISEDLDKKYGIQRKHRGFSQRDVPGITQAVIPTLVQHGIAAVSVGVNSESSPPAVPNPFVWKYGNDSVLAMWHPGGYPGSPGIPGLPGGLSRKDCVIVDGLDHVLCFAFRSDNRGPPEDVVEVTRYYATLDAEYPGATIRGSTFEDYISHLLPFKEKLPVINNEIGDTWIQGIMSDPKKMAQYRTISRARSECLESGQCQDSDPRMSRFSRYLVKIAEHTYGLNFVDDLVNWSNEAFEKSRQERTFEKIEMSWKEQRDFLTLAMDELGSHPLLNKIKAKLQELEPSVPSPSGYKKISIPTPAVSCSNGITIQIGSNGEITKLIDASTKIDWAACTSNNCGLGLMMYNSYNETDIADFGRQYNYGLFGPGFHKPGMELFAKPEKKQWITKGVEIWQKEDESCSFLTKLALTDSQSWKKYGAPQILWIQTDVNSRDGHQGVDITVQYFNKTSTRIPESLMFNFFPPSMPGYQWQLNKMGRLVDPMNVVLNGSQMVHGIQDGIQYTKPGSHGIQITSPDVPVVSIVTKDLPATPYTVPLKPLSAQPIGMAYNFVNNVWNTNYIFWYPYMDGDENFKARFRINLI